MRNKKSKSKKRKKNIVQIEGKGAMKRLRIVFFSFLVLNIFCLEAMDYSFYKNSYEALEIIEGELTGKNEAERLDIVKKAYKKLASKYHPDKSTGDEEKFKIIANAKEKLEKKLKPFIAPIASTGPTLKKEMKKAHADAWKLIIQVHRIDNPEVARKKYEEAIVPFQRGTATKKSTIEYGFDIIGLVYWAIVRGYNSKGMYEKAVKYGKQYLTKLDLIIKMVEKELRKTSRAPIHKRYSFEKFNFAGHDVPSAFKVLKDKFEDLKKLVIEVFTELKSKFNPIWNQAKIDFNSGDPKKIKAALATIEGYFKKDYFKHKYIVGSTSYDLFGVLIRRDYIKAYLKLAEAYLTKSNKEEEKKALEKGLKIYNDLYPGGLKFASIKNEFESKLIKIKKEEVEDIRHQVAAGDRTSGKGVIESNWKKAIKKLYQLQPEGDKLAIEVWKKIIKRAEDVGDIAKAHEYATEVIRNIKLYITKHDDYVTEVSVIIEKEKTLKVQMDKIKRKKDEVQPEFTVALNAFKNGKYKDSARIYRAAYAKLLPFAKYDPEIRNWILVTYYQLILRVEEPTKRQLVQQVWNYENEWQGLDFTSYKSNIKKELEKLDPTFIKVLEGENLIRPLKDLTRKLQSLQRKLS